MRIRFKLEKDKVLVFKNTGNPFVLLEDTEGRGIWLPIVIGQLEFNSITWVLNGFVPLRPGTHDLFKTVTEVLGGTIEKVVVTKFQDNAYFSEIHLKKPDGSTMQIDSRTSDAIALALRFGCPILVEEEIVENLPEISVDVTETGVEMTYWDKETQRVMPDLESMPTHDRKAMEKEFRKISKPTDKDKLS